ncbi:MAG TPA: FmdB family zinc ribbon protein [Candidatus Polarisedimenticolaceae bacterium]|nr:FmdB family zinc ribbon protein [Candidatus Polarisedimenticolaceae bacterium]
MPIYEYRCRSCGVVTEVIQKIGDKPLRRCEKCSGSLEKLISRTAFQLKGGGWYQDGYNKGGSKSSGSATKSDSKSDKPAKSEGKGETPSKPDSGKKASSALA